MRIFKDITMYDFSKDYEKLYDLVRDGHRVVAFVDYSFRGSLTGHVMRDVCIVEKRKGGSLVGFVRGISYFEVEDWQTPELTMRESFVVDCILLLYLR